MNSTSFANTPVSATPSQDALPPEISEADFLDLQVSDARWAIVHTTHEVADTLYQVAAEHPFVALSTAAVVGALVARVATHKSKIHTSTAPLPPQPVSETAIIPANLLEMFKPMVFDLVLSAVTCGIERAFVTMRSVKESSPTQ